MRINLNAGWHTAKDLNIPQNITLHWLPPYSPELNPVEYLWDEIREKWFLNRYFASLDSVENQLMLALKDLMENPKTGNIHLPVELDD